MREGFQVFVFLLLVLARNLAYGVFPSSFPQPNISLSGKVLDVENKEPVALAHVFFNKTSCGTYSEEDGSFSLSCDEHSTELFVSHVGYLHKIVMVETSNESQLLIYLEPSTEELMEVVVSGSRKEKGRGKNMKVFESEFLGRSKLARKCVIENPEVIDFTKTDQYLYASSEQPITVRNYASGYTVEFYLEHFEFNSNTQLPKYWGYSFIEEMDTSNFALKKKWEKRREQHYLGSFEHFVSSLIRSEVEKEGFKIFNGDSIAIEIVPVAKGNTLIKVSSDMLIEYFPETESAEYQTWLNKVNFLNKKMTFYGNEPVFFPQTNKPQTTVISPEAGEILVNQYGQVLNQEAIVLNGYMGWERVLELLPSNYNSK